MSCIKDHLLQKYIDGETTPAETAKIKEHVIRCTSCALKIDDRRKLAARVREAINLLPDDHFELPLLRYKQPPLTKRSSAGKFIFYAISSACILYLVMIYTGKKEPAQQEHVFIIHTTGPEYDANHTITDQEIIINVIDQQGKESQSFYDL